MNDEPNASTTTATGAQPNEPQRPTSNHDREGWKAYWTAQGMPWRTESEIDEQRQRYLAERRAVQSDSERGIYPFKDVKLDRADVEWLLAIHESGGMRGPVDWSDEQQHAREGLDLRGADLRRVDLRALPLTRVRGALRGNERRTTAAWQDDAAAVQLEGSNLSDTHLEGGDLSGAHLEGALLIRVHLERADLTEAHFEGATLRQSHLEVANLEGAHLEGAVVDEGTHLEGASLIYAKCDANTIFANVHLNSPQYGPALLVNVVWGNATVAGVDWAQVAITGEGRVARQPDRLPLPAMPHATRTLPRVVLFQYAVRANRQLAIALRAQGISEWSDHFAFRAQVLERQVLRRQRKFLRYLGSLFLGLISGYGYRPLRSVATYLLVILGFAAAYYLLGNNASPALDPHGALVFSLTSFHGRGFSPGGSLSPDNPLTTLAAAEAVIGLLIEITFIATFTQRFFAR